MKRDVWVLAGLLASFACTALRPVRLSDVAEVSERCQFERALQLWSQLPDSERATFDALILRARLLTYLERDEETLEVVRQAGSLATDRTQRAILELARGFVFVHRHQLEESLEAFHRAEEEGWDREILINARAFALLHAGQRPEARRAMDQAIALAPRVPGVWFNSAVLHAIDGDTSEAVADLHTWWRRGERNPAAIVAQPELAALVREHRVDDLLRTPRDEIRCPNY
jgi:Flp pilus assembly protein TadD